jgi:hypothetical protein
LKFNQQFPIINQTFICNVLYAVSYTPNQETTNYPELHEFFNQYYRVLMGEEGLTSRENLSQVLSYEADKMVTMIENNIEAHYISRLCGYINNLLGLKTQKSAIDSRTDTSASDKKTFKRNISYEAKLVKDDILTGSVSSGEKWCQWVRNTRITLRLPNIEKTVPYDLVVNPMSFLPSFFQLQMWSATKFRALPLRTSNIPSYITLDTNVLRFLFGISSGKNKTPKDTIWSIVFNMKRREFMLKKILPLQPKDKKIKFHFLLQTDGVGVSLIFKDSDKTKSSLRTICC